MMKQVLIILLLLFTTIFRAQNFKKLQAESEKEYNNANFPKALQLAEQALKEAEKDKKATADDIIDVKADYAVSLFYNDRMEEAIELMGKLISETETTKVKPQTEISVHMNYGAILVSLGLYSNALPEFQKAYDLCKTNSYEKEDVVSIITTLAECNQYLYRFEESERLSKEAIAYCEKNGLTNNIVYASAYSGLATLYTDMMFEKKSVETYKTTETIFIKNKDTLGPEFAVFLSNYGTLLANTYQHEQALSLLMRSKTLTLKLYGENSAEYAGCLNNLGFTYNQMGKLMETEQFYKKSLEIKRSLKRVRFDHYLTSVNNLQTFYSSTGRTAEAEDLVQELEKGMEDPRLQDTLKRMTFAENLAEYYSRKKQYVKARKYLDDAIIYTKSIYGDNNIELGNMYISIAILLIEQGKTSDAAKYMTKVPEVIKENSKGNLAESVSLIRNYAVTLSTRFSKHAEAEPFINESVKLVEQKVITNKNEIADIYFQKAQISSELNKVSTAIEYFNKYLELKYSQIEESFRYMTEAEKLQFLETFEIETKNFFTSISNHVQQHPELINMLLNYRIQTKSMLLNNMSKIKKSIAQLNDPVLNEKFTKLKLDRENISKLMSLNTDEYAAALSEVDALKREADQLEKEISAKVSQSNFSGYQKIQWKDIQKQLGPDECAVEIVRTNLIYQNDSAGTNYSFIILKNTGEPSMILIDRQITWEEEVLTHYRNSINSKKDAPDLYRRLWKNISEKIGNISTVYVSADGIYNQVNLNTLFNTDSKKYLLEEKDIHYVSTLRDIIEIKNKP
ncbi:MAG: tetratricopeptide repeat protein, partial [Bacteroidia bacterium]